MAPNKGYDSYWQLDSYSTTNAERLKDLLKQQGYRIPKNAPKYQLVIMQQRADRGHLDYDKYPKEQLWKFVINRKLVNRQLPKQELQTHSAAAHILRDADNQLKFIRFGDLPAELRIRIYQYHFRSFGAVLISPAVPPITRTCREVRNESLPVFYRSVNFHITFQTRQDVNPFLYRPSHETAGFLLSLQPQFVSEIRRLKVTIADAYKRQGYENLVAEFGVSVELDKAGDEYDVDVDVMSGQSWNGTRYVASNPNRIAAGFSKVLDEVCARDGTRNLRLTDIYALRRVMEEAKRAGRGIAN